MRDHYPETIVPESRPGDPNTAVREISTEQAAREEALVREVVASFDDTPSPAAEAADAGPDPAPARVRAGGPADHRGMGRRHRVPHRGAATSPTTAGRSSSCCPTSSASRCRPSPSTTRPTGTPPRPPCSGRSSSRTRPRSRSAATSPTGRPASRAGSRAWSPTPTASPSRAPGSRSGRPTRTASTTCSTPTTASAARAHLFSDEEGRYAFWGITPTPYPIPHDGPVGELLAATGRSPMRASHLHFMVSADGLHTLVTHIFVRGRRVPRPRHRLRRQGVPRQGLRGTARRHAHPRRPSDRRRRGARARFDIVLAPARGTKDEDVHWIAVHEGHRLT